MNSPAKARNKCVKCRADFSVNAIVCILLSSIPYSSLIMLISAGISLCGYVLNMMLPKSTENLQDIVHRAYTLSEYIAMSKITSKAYTYATKSSTQSIKTILAGAAMAYQADMLKAQMSIDSECSKKESRYDESSRRTPNDSVYLQGIVHLYKKSGEAILNGGIYGSLKLVMGWLKA